MEDFGTTIWLVGIIALVTKCVSEKTCKFNSANVPLISTSLIMALSADVYKPKAGSCKFPEYKLLTKLRTTVGLLTAVFNNLVTLKALEFIFMFPEAAMSYKICTLMRWYPLLSMKVFTLCVRN